MRPIPIAIVLTVVGFLAGYALASDPVEAYYGQNPGQGYFSGTGNDTSGWEFLNASCSTSGEYGPYNYYNGSTYCNSIPRDLNTAAELIAFIEGRLANGIPNGQYGFGGGTYGDTRARTGAAAIVHTMLDTPFAQRYRPPNATQMTAWRDLVNQYAAAGRINWNDTDESWTVNSMFQGTDDSPSPNDVTFYNGNRTGYAIVFTAVNGTKYSIRRACGNPMGATSLPALNNHTVTPSVSANDTVVQEGDTVTFTYTLTKSGTTSSSAFSVCKAVGSVHPPGSALGAEFADRSSSGGQSPPQPTCPSSINNNTPVTVLTENMPVTGFTAGTRVCRSLVINPYNGTGGTYSASAEACVLIAKTPYVHFTGGDVWAGGGFAQSDGTCTTNTNADIITSSNQSSSAGSVSEYAAFALDNITDFGSGNKALFNNTATYTDVAARLTFANNASPIGNFAAPQHCMNDYSAYFDSLPLSSPPALTSSSSGAWHAASLAGFGGTLPNGVDKIYYIDGNVTITSNIAYSNSYSNLAAIPSLVVIAEGDIRVDPAVTQLDGIFISRGTFYTCYPKPSPPTNSTCSNLLTINGAVGANNVDLYRTRGAAGATVAERQQPAEIFNYSPELLLRSALSGYVSNPVSTSSVRELPPRF